MKATTLRSDLHRVGSGLSVRFVFASGGMEAEWQPRPPTKREWTRVIESYRGARNQFMVEVGRHLGLSVLCVEVGP
jgi:hypothetical protein